MTKEDTIVECATYEQDALEYSARYNTLTNRDLAIKLLKANTKESDKEFFDKFLSSDSSFIRNLRGYTSSREAVHIVLNQNKL